MREEFSTVLALSLCDSSLSSASFSRLSCVFEAASEFFRKIVVFACSHQSSLLERWLVRKIPEVTGGTECDEIDSINRTQSLLFTSAVPRWAGGWERLNRLCCWESRFLVNNKYEREHQMNGHAESL